MDSFWDFFSLFHPPFSSSIIFSQCVYSSLFLFFRFFFYSPTMKSWSKSLWRNTFVYPNFALFIDYNIFSVRSCYFLLCSLFSFLSLPLHFFYVFLLFLLHFLLLFHSPLANVHLQNADNSISFGMMKDVFSVHTLDDIECQFSCYTFLFFILLFSRNI